MTLGKAVILAMRAMTGEGAKESSITGTCLEGLPGHEKGSSTLSSFRDTLISWASPFDTRRDFSTLVFPIEY